ncbi:hypothetical protein [Mesorhizobium sp. LjNodule214]|uniref:hypothetical protein n=1 Tax=Mesorhizobium sp. LjNodule214 TaxID=3342252 RepID=UPI003ED06C3F
MYKRRAWDQETFDLTVDAILSDLMHHHLVDYPEGIHVIRSNRVLGTKGRYRPRAYSKVFPRILDLLAKPELGYVRQDKAAPILGAFKSTVIRPGPTLLARIDDADIATDDLDEHPHGETIILSTTTHPSRIVIAESLMTSIDGWLPPTSSMIAGAFLGRTRPSTSATDGYPASSPRRG